VTPGFIDRLAREKEKSKKLGLSSGRYQELLVTTVNIFAKYWSANYLISLYSDSFDRIAL
jgi:hypothetical protein